MTARSVLVAALAFVLAGAACAGPAPVAGRLSEEDVAAINDLAERRMVEALLAEDFAAFAALFTEDAVRMPPNEPLHEGRAAIEAWTTSNWGPLTTTEFTQRALEIDGRGDLAYVRGVYSATVEVPGVPEPITEDGKMLAILRKQPDGSWLVSRAIYNADAPPAPMASPAGQ
ncbi:MAG: SgcJ/EcaC family oxidoreductase [Gemmatimonadales bacterium]